MDDGQQLIRVNGKEYAFPPTSLTLGEMCDAEQYFGVDFNQAAQSGMRMIAALLWITIRRDDKTVTVDDVRGLDPQVFDQLAAAGDAGPPTPGGSGSSGPPSNGSTANSVGSEPDPSLSGSRGSDTGSTSDPPTSATSPPTS
jgi:hypothetical protein